MQKIDGGIEISGSETSSELQRVSDFKKEVYKYCDRNVGKKVLFTIFTNFYYSRLDNNYITPKDLTSKTELILNSLINKNILREVEKTPEFETIHALYEILPHEKLIKEDNHY